MTIVVVYGDGRIGHADLPFTVGHVYRRPIMRPMRVVSEDQPRHASIEYEEFTRSSTLFNGTPVYCARGWTTQEARIDGLFASRLDADDCYDELRRKVERIAYDGVGAGRRVFLDEWRGELPMSEGERAARLVRRGYKILVAEPQP